MSSLLHAAGRGDLRALQEAIRRGEDLNSTEEVVWMTPLMYAAGKGNTAIVEELLSSGATVDLKNRFGATALIQAASEGHTETVQKLLSSGAKVDLGDDSGNTALIQAAKKGHTGTIRVLLSSGATVDQANRSGDTALMGAASKGHMDTLRVLLSSGATVDKANKNGMTALWTAKTSRDSNPETIRFLEEAETSAKRSKLPQRETPQVTSLPVSVPVLPRNWTVVTDRKSNKPAYQNTKTMEDKIFTPPGYPLQQTSTHPGVTFYGEAQKQAFTSRGSHADFNNGVELRIPPYIVPPGSTLGIKVQPSLAPKDVFVMPQGIESASPSFLVSSEGGANGEVTLTLEHHLEVTTKEEADDLVFLQANSSPKRSGSKPVYEFQEIPNSRSEFIPGGSKGRLTTNLKHISNKFIKVGVKIKKFFHGLKPRDRNLYTVRIYRSPPETTGDRMAIIVASLQGQLYSKFLEDLDRVVIQRDYPEVSTKVADRTTLGSLRFEELNATLSILPVQGWSVEPDKHMISKSEVNQPETEKFKPEDLHDYPPRIVCRFYAEPNAPKRVTSTLSLVGFKTEVKVTIPLKAPHIKVNSTKLLEAAVELKSTVVKVKDTRLASTVKTIVSLMERMAVTLQSSSSLDDLVVHTDSIKTEIGTVLRVCEAVAKECTRKTMKENIGVSLSEMEVLSHQLWQVTRVKLKHCEDPLEKTAALVDLVESGSSLMRTVSRLLKDIQTLSDITSMPVDDAKLKRDIKEYDLYHLAGFFETAEGYLVQLGLTAGEQTDVRTRSLLYGTQAAMEDALKIWRRRNPFSATFKALVDILLDMGKRNVAVQVCKYCVGH